MKIHHLGYLVRKIEEAKEQFVCLGYNISKNTVYDKYRDVDICFLEKDGYMVELVAPASKESVVYNLLKKMGNSPYHICYESDDFNGDIQHLLEEHYVICSETQIAPALDGKNVCFLIHPYLGMIEIKEK